MSDKSHHARNNIAYVTMGVSVVSLVILAIIAIVYGDKNNAMTIFNTILPVFASWVGTILAFYFGRENFESANNQVRKMIEHLSPEERSSASIDSIMRTPQQVIKYKDTSNISKVSIGELVEFLEKNNTSRLIITDKNIVTHIIHQSSFNKYIAHGGSKDELLADFLSSQESEGIKYTAGSAFITLPKKSTLKEAKEKMLKETSIQDIVITENGKSDEPMIGWVSNIRMSKFLS